jgi:hypothetical protein
MAGYISFSAGGIAKVGGTSFLIVSDVSNFMLAAANSIFKGMPPATDGGSYEFTPCDVSLMKNIHATTSELLARLPKLNYLVLTSGFLGMGGRDDTEEGIDRKLALHYYARWKFTNDVYDLRRLILRNESDDACE